MVSVNFDKSDTVHKNGIGLIPNTSIGISASLVKTIKGVKMPVQSGTVQLPVNCLNLEYFFLFCYCFLLESMAAF